MTGILPLQTKIEIGHHVQAEWLGLTFNLDTIWATVVAGALVVVLGFVARRALTRTTYDRVPTKVQLVWEGVVGQVNREVEANMGRLHPLAVPMAVSLFFFILFANWLEILPTHINDHVHLLPPPTADTNLTYALAALAMVSVWVHGIKVNGVKNYFKHFVEPYAVLLPLNVLEELVKPITLALRLFGNIFASSIMLSLISLLPLYVLWAPNLLWKAFAIFIGAIQAFIFALLTVIYFGIAGAGHEAEDEQGAAPSPEYRTDAENLEPATAP